MSPLLPPPAISASPRGKCWASVAFTLPTAATTALTPNFGCFSTAAWRGQAANPQSWWLRPCEATLTIRRQKTGRSQLVTFSALLATYLPLLPGVFWEGPWFSRDFQHDWTTSLTVPVRLWPAWWHSTLYLSSLLLSASTFFSLPHSGFHIKY